MKHLELVQAMITRLAQNSFAVRGWAVTLVSVLFALIASKDAPGWAALVALLPTLVFWGLDAYYLRQERLFRGLYDAIARDLRGGGSAVELFAMDTSKFAGTDTGWASILFSRTGATDPGPVGGRLDRLRHPRAAVTRIRPRRAAEPLSRRRASATRSPDGGHRLGRPSSAVRGTTCT